MAEAPSSVPAPSDRSPSSSARPSGRRTSTGVFAGIRVGSIGGVEISLDYSWFIIFFLILGTFAGVVFPAQAPGVDRLGYLVMGFVGAALFFISLLLHELAHAFMALRRGVGVEGITLFIFGGMARTERDASSPGDEFAIAVVGPLASFALAVLFYGLALAGSAAGAPLAITVVAEYLGFLNLLLAIFNLLPGFPLDGGRLLRAILWRITGSMRKGTEIAANAGRALGFGLIGLGLFSLLVGGGLIGGLWLVFIGWFLGHAARSSYQQVLLQDMLSPLSAHQAMTSSPETVAPDIPLEELVNSYFLRRPFNSFPVTEDGVPIGMVTLRQVKAVPRQNWSGKVVADLMTPLQDVVVVDPETSMLDVLRKMQSAEVSRVLVAREWELVGIISSTDLARWLDRMTLVE
jgi:Zn-dependent protease/CBS domain-containing protein